MVAGRNAIQSFPNLLQSVCKEPADLDFVLVIYIYLEFVFWQLFVCNQTIGPTTSCEHRNRGHPPGYGRDELDQCPKSYSYPRIVKAVV